MTPDVSPAQMRNLAAVLREISPSGYVLEAASDLCSASDQLERQAARIAEVKAEAFRLKDKMLKKIDEQDTDLHIFMQFKQRSEQAESQLSQANARVEKLEEALRWFHIEHHCRAKSGGTDHLPADDEYHASLALVAVKALAKPGPEAT